MAVIARERMKAVYLPLRIKFMILFCFLIVIPFVVIGTITYLKYSEGVERNTAELSNQLVDQMSVSLDRYIKEIERLTLMPFYDETIMHILKNHREFAAASPYLTTDETSKMNLFISSLSYDRPELASISIFTNDGSVFSNLEQSIKSRWNMMTADEDWVNRLKEEDGGLVILPPHQADYYMRPMTVVSIARIIREPYSNKTLGAIKIDLTPIGFESILSTASLGGNGSLTITDRSGEQMNASEPTDRGEYSATEASSATDDAFIRASVQSDYTGLQITAMMSRYELRKEARELSRYTLIVSIAALAAAVIAAVVSASRLVRPIAHLHAKMRLAKRGMFQERAIVTTNDEIGQLTEGFNGMIGEIDRLVKEVYETKLREREAELFALQSQIHPHFLYNTLEMMNMLALQGNGQQLSMIATNLGKLLRYTVDRKEQQVLLQDELKFVDSYLQIQALRLGNNLRTSVRVDSSYDRCVVPKLMLQPLVENVIEHAMGSAPVELMISARVEEDDWIIMVKDNGVGMSQERMLNLEKAIHESEHMSQQQGSSFGQVRKGFALRNVHQRIRLLHGEPYGLTLDHAVEQGVTFHIRLPIEWGI
ncbi:cache domain-containing sensor histidine kinase [Paenibacillus sp. strain BS8-2]